MDRVHVEVKSDHVEKLTRPSRKFAGLTELIWNGLDAEAKAVSVAVADNGLGGVSQVIVTDDGHGMTRDEALDAFGTLGGSWKRSAPGGLSKNRDRALHGSEGQGRWRAFGIGSLVRWITVAEDGGKRRRVVITGSQDSLTDFDVSDAEETDEPTGTRVEIENIRKESLGLLGETVYQALIAEFALYLERYVAVDIRYRGTLLDPSSIIDRRDVLTANFGSDLGPAEVTVIEWKTEFPRALLLCDEQGSVLGEVPPGIQAPGFSFTVYARWPGFRTHESELMLADMGNPNVSPAVEAVRTELRQHFRSRTKDKTSELIEGWKAEEVYPYVGEAESPVEQVERDLFDVVALAAASAVNNASERSGRRLSLRLLKEAVESNPGSLHRVLTEVLELPSDRLNELATLLNRTTLADIVASANVVANRLDFLRSLEILLFERDNKKSLLERRQLHRILATETWLFGDEYALAVDDEPLTQVLKKHLALLGRPDLAADVDEKVIQEDGVHGVVDLMLSKAVELPRSREHLVIELKRPSVKIGPDEITQIERYAFAVAGDERFASTSTRWEFWVVSNELSDYAKQRSSQLNLPVGAIHQSDSLTIWVHSWGQVIEACRRRLKFVQENLNYQSTRDNAIQYLRTTHASYLPDTVE